ncbi:MAG: SusC/RagA family TonB-linked outer membrane protein, partial [Bacteroidales bacterium]|nr:SusC/RagA family TonB-linked outer membrane protein [Bacteroidales bacterium]
MTHYQHKISGRFYRIVLSALFSFLIPVFMLSELAAQNRTQQPLTVYGTVKDAKGLPIMGAKVLLQESTLSTETDEGGNFELEVPGVGSILFFEADGFDQLSITVSSVQVDAVLQYSVEGQGLKDRVYMPWAVTDKRSVTSSITTITQDELRKSPVMSLVQAVSGRLPGFTVLQSAQQPGDENPVWRIRGIRTLEEGGMNNMEKGGIGSPIAIVDGFERSFNDFDPNEIESFSILRDASATALYGLRGANGVILVTTKRGQENRRTIDLEMSTGIVTPTRLPKYLDSYNFTKLFNEARINDGLAPVYTDEDIENYRLGSDPLTYPNNDYYGEFLKPYAMQTKAALSLSGGNKIVKYFTSFSYNSQGGLYDRTSEPNRNKLETPSSFQRFNVRTNLDITISPRVTAYFNMAARLKLVNRPYISESTIFDMLSSYPPNAFAHSFMGIDPSLNKEIFMLGGSNIYTQTPLKALSHNGNREDTYRDFQVAGGLNYDLGFITEGLAANFQMDVDGNNLYIVEQYYDERVWNRAVQLDGSIVYTEYNTPSSISRSTSSDTYDYNGSNLNLTYDRTFGNHAISGFAMWRRFKTVYRQANQADRKLEDYALRVNYAFKNRYFLEASATLSGSDNFYLSDVPRMLFPAVSAAWIVSDESFLEGSDFITFLKLRGSYGRSGNDEYSYTDPNGYKYRYAYRDRWWSSTTGAVAFGISATFSPLTVYEGVIPNQGITSEKATMSNFGLDMKLLNDKIFISTDMWFEKRYDIYVRGLGTIPNVFGATDDYLPITNEGIVNSKGMEIVVGWNDKIGDFSYWINASYDVFSNEIVFMSEPTKDFAYLTETGGPVRQDWGLVALGLFKNQDDVDNSPVQTFGPYQAGDIKYEDLNGDNIIDVNDYKAIGKGTFPNKSYAMDMGFRLKQFDFSMLWQGSTDRSFYLNNNYVRPFDDFGSISEYALGRYTDEASWATADFPRLTTQSNNNNLRISTFWLKDATFIRLRNLEFGYNLTAKNAGKLGLYGARIYLN